MGISGYTGGTLHRIIFGGTFAALASNDEEDGRPITQVGTSLIVDPTQMGTNKPYATEYRGKPAVAVKHKDGAVAFYRVPQR